MNTRKFVHDPQILLEQGKTILSSKNEHKFAFRVAMVNLILAGSITSSELSSLTGVPSRTLSTWVKKADEKGFESLQAVRQTGRPNKLSNNQTAIIKDAITGSPEDFGYRVWDGPSLSDFISKKFNVTMSVRQCQRLFHKLGFSLIRAQTYPSLDEQNDTERNDFKKK